MWPLGSLIVGIASRVWRGSILTSDADRTLDNLLDLKPDSAWFVSSEFQCDDLGTVGQYFNRLGTKLKSTAAGSP